MARANFGKTLDIEGSSEFGQGAYRVSHCGHPTALWPWAIEAPDGSLLVSWTGRAFQTKAAAMAACSLFLSGEFVAQRCFAETQVRLGILERGHLPGRVMDCPLSWKRCQAAMNQPRERK